MELLGKYRILEELGKGGFATVYRAVDTTLDREVALKVLDPLLMRDETWVARFRHEARAVANLRHPHIVNIHEIGEIEGRLYIAMELARGGSLAQVIEARGRIPWSEALALLQPICAALDYAHGQEVVHCDLKPANILLDAEAGPLLTDFGFARLLVDNSVSMSISGGILGTPAYIAPEIWELDQAERPADIYALGCILYEMLVGSALFGGKTPMQAMRAHDKGAQYPAAWPDGVPPEILVVLDKTLARKPERRYATAGALWHALSTLEAQAESAREAAERAAVAAQWRDEAEAAMTEGEWSAAKMAVGRWLTVTPEDEDALQVQQQIEKRMAEIGEPVAASSPKPGGGYAYQQPPQLAGAIFPVAPSDPLEKPYQYLQTLIAAGRWSEAEQLARVILTQQANYRDVPALARRVAQEQAAVQRKRLRSSPARPAPVERKKPPAQGVPPWAWAVGAGFVVVCIIIAILAVQGLPNLLGAGEDPPAATATQRPPTPPPPPTAPATPVVRFVPEDWQYGVRVNDLVANSPAERSGSISPGDYIIAINDQALGAGEGAFSDLVQSYAPDETVIFWLLPQLSGEPFSVTITLAEHPELSERGYLGVYHQSDSITVRFDETMFSGEFSAGRGGVGNECRVIDQSVTVTQLDLFEDEWFYFAVPFTDEDLGKHLIWAVHSPDGGFEYRDVIRTISNDEDRCFWQGFALGSDSEPGEYELVVRSGNHGVIYSETFTVEYYDLSTVPRPERDPLGNFTFGRSGVNSGDCVVSNPITRLNLGALADNEWFYFASSYTMDEIDNSLTWNVLGPEGQTIYSSSRILQDTLDLCLWQGFALDADSMPGTYTLEIEYNSRIVYRQTFQLVE